MLLRGNADLAQSNCRLGKGGTTCPTGLEIINYILVIYPSGRTRCVVWFSVIAREPRRPRQSGFFIHHENYVTSEVFAKLRHSGMFLAGLKRLRFERLKGGPKGERSE